MREQHGKTEVVGVGVGDRGLGGCESEYNEGIVRQRAVGLVVRSPSIADLRLKETHDAIVRFLVMVARPAD